MNSIKEKIEQLLESAYDFGEDDEIIDDNFLTKPERVCREIAEMNHQELIPVLRTLLQSEPDELKRDLIVLVLSFVRNEESTNILLNLLEQDNNPKIQATAVSTLANRKGERIIPALTKMLLKGKDAEVRAEAAYSLSIQKPSNLLDLFKRAWTTELSRDVKFQIAITIAEYEGENSSYTDYLKEMKGKNQLSESQELRLKHLLERFDREGMKEVKEVLNLFDDFYEDDDYSEEEEEEEEENGWDDDLRLFDSDDEDDDDDEDEEDSLEGLEKLF